MDEYLAHHGILGMRWGIRRYHDADGSLTAAGRRRYTKEQAKAEKKDEKWVKKNGEKIYKQAYSKVKGEADSYLYNDLAEKYKGQTYTTRGKLNQSLVNDYNKKLASLMNTAVGDISAPSGRVIRYVAKRGSVGVYTALATSGYDMGNVRNGVWSGGRIAYRKDTVRVR